MLSSKSDKTYVVYVGKSYEDAAQYWTGDSWSFDEDEAALYENESDAYRVARHVGGKVD